MTFKTLPYVGVKYKLVPLDPERVAADVRYFGVYLAPVGKAPIIYSEKGFEEDYAQAKADGLRLGDLRDDPSVSVYRSLSEAKPEERYAIEAGARLTPLA